MNFLDMTSNPNPRYSGLEVINKILVDSFDLKAGYIKIRVRKKSSRIVIAGDNEDIISDVFVEYKDALDICKSFFVDVFGIKESFYTPTSKSQRYSNEIAYCAYGDDRLKKSAHLYFSIFVINNHYIDYKKYDMIIKIINPSLGVLDVADALDYIRGVDKSSLYESMVFLSGNPIDLDI